MQPLALTITAVLLVVPAALGISLNGHCDCTREFRPVCGSDTRTYTNPCLLRCTRELGLSTVGRNLVEVSSGPCTQSHTDAQAPLQPQGTQHDPCACNRDYSPVCGNDGQTYSNECSLNCARVERTSNKGIELAIAHYGECGFVREQSTLCICTFIYHPICGNDGLTYPNDCLLNCARRDKTSPKGEALEIAHSGPCNRETENKSEGEESEETSPQMKASCPLQLAPVCGTDGVTYDNECFLKVARSIGESTTGSELALAYTGPCEADLRVLQPEPVAICPALLAPVCGNDGVTYDNRCLLDYARRLKTSTKGADLKLAYEGGCVTV